MQDLGFLKNEAGWGRELRFVWLERMVRISPRCGVDGILRSMYISIEASLNKNETNVVSVPLGVRERGDFVFHFSGPCDRWLSRAEAH